LLDSSGIPPEQKKLKAAMIRVLRCHPARHGPASAHFVSAQRWLRQDTPVAHGFRSCFLSPRAPVGLASRQQFTALATTISES